MAQPDIAVLLEEHTKWLHHETDSKYPHDLQATDFSEADLHNIDLSYGTLDYSDFSGSNLTNANLNNASLYHTDLQLADLSGTNLRDSYLVGADLRGCDLSNADLCNCDLFNADLRGAKLVNADLRGTTFNYLDYQYGDEYFNAIVDRNVFIQLSHWLCGLQVDDDECREIQRMLNKLANESYTIKKSQE